MAPTQAEWTFITDQARELANDLNAYARSAVRLNLIDGDNLAFTVDAGKAGNHIEISLNPSVLLEIRNRERAIQVWRGLGFHELAHHLWPAAEQYKQALREGIKDTFNLLDDEQNERRARAQSNQWGAYFQTTVAWAFQTRRTQETREDLSCDTFLDRRNEFGYHFRRHLPGARRPCVQKALSLIPSNLKDLSKDDLLALARQVHEVLQQGAAEPVSVPISPSESSGTEPEDAPIPGPAVAEEPAHTAPPITTPRGAQAAPEPNSAVPAKGGTFSHSPTVQPQVQPIKNRQQRLLESRWSYALLAVFVIVWVAVLTHRGLETWDSAFSILGWLAVALIAGCVLFVWLDHLYQGWLAKRALMQQQSFVSDSPSGDLPVDDKDGGTEAVNQGGGAGPSRGPFARRNGGTGLRSRTLRLAASVLTGLYEIAGKIAGCLYTVVRFLCLRLVLPIARLLVIAVMFLVWVPVAVVKAGYRAAVWTGKVLCYIALKIWRSKVFRIFLLSMPLATVLAMLIAVVVHHSLTELILLLILIIILLLISWLLRKPLGAFVSPSGDSGSRSADGQASSGSRVEKSSRPPPCPAPPPPSLPAPAGSTSSPVAVAPPVPSVDYNTGEGMDFDPIPRVRPVQPNESELQRLLPDVVPLAQQMRKYLEQTGLMVTDLDDQEQGQDLVEDMEKVCLGDTAVYVDDQKVARASVHIEVLIDCSGSMDCHNHAGAEKKISLAKRFGLLVEEAVRGVRGITCHFWGFENLVIWDCGTAGEYRVSGLPAEGGNNDAAGLWHAFQHASKSGKELKLLLMVSDGLPSSCTWKALHNLVGYLESVGYIPVQIAVDEIAKPAFETWFVNLAGKSMEMAVAEFGRLVLSLVEMGIVR